MAEGKTVRGRIVRHDGPYIVVECPDLPDFLKTMHLTAYQFTRGTPRDVGSEVKLVFTTSSASALWIAHPL